jgi:DNA uptake protein ComE-like DNA-binding protein
MKLLLPLALVLSLAACTQQRASEPKPENPPRQEDPAAPPVQDPAAQKNADEQRARERGQQVGEKAREATEDVQRESRELAEKAKAAAQGISEGWKSAEQVDVNHASQTDLEKKLGLTPEEAGRVVANRPYTARGDLQRVLPEEKYQSIAGRIAVK